MFAIQSGIAIVGLALAVALIPFPSVTSDKLLGAVFGGFFVGAGVGLAIRCGGEGWRCKTTNGILVAVQNITI